MKKAEEFIEEINSKKGIYEKYEFFFFTYLELLKRFYKKLIKTTLALVGILLIYGFLSFIYLQIYENWGFERTVILLGVAVVFITLRVFAANTFKGD